MADAFQGTLSGQPILLLWYGWGSIVGLLVSLLVGTWIVIDAWRTDKEARTWALLVAGAVLLGLPVLIVRFRPDLAPLLPGALPLFAYLGIGGLLLALVAGLIYAADLPLGEGRDEYDGGLQVGRVGPPVVAASLFALTIGLAFLATIQSAGASVAVRVAAAERPAATATTPPTAETPTAAPSNHAGDDPTAAPSPASAETTTPVPTTESSETAGASIEDGEPQAPVASPSDAPAVSDSPPVASAILAAVLPRPAPTPRPAATPSRAIGAGASSESAPPAEVFGPPVPPGIELPTPVVVLAPSEDSSVPAPAVSPGPRLDLEAGALGLPAIAPTPGSGLDQALDAAGMAQDRFRRSLAGTAVTATPTDAERGR